MVDTSNSIHSYLNLIPLPWYFLFVYFLYNVEDKHADAPLDSVIITHGYYQYTYFISRELIKISFLILQRYKRQLLRNTS